MPESSETWSKTIKTLENCGADPEGVELFFLEVTQHAYGAGTSTMEYLFSILDISRRFKKMDILPVGDTIVASGFPTGAMNKTAKALGLTLREAIKRWIFLGWGEDSKHKVPEEAKRINKRLADLKIKTEENRAIMFSTARITEPFFEEIEKILARRDRSIKMGFLSEDEADAKCLGELEHLKTTIEAEKPAESEISLKVIDRVIESIREPKILPCPSCKEDLIFDGVNLRCKSCGRIIRKSAYVHRLEEMLEENPSLADRIDLRRLGRVVLDAFKHSL